MTKEGKLCWCFFNGWTETKSDITHEYGVILDCISSFIEYRKIWCNCWS